MTSWMPKPPAVSKHAKRKRISRVGAAVLDLSLAIALPLATQASRLTKRGRGEGEQARKNAGRLTPAGGAFAIWAPIFAAVAAYGVQRVRHHDDTGNASAEALARASLVANILWSLNAQYRGFGWRSVALIGVSAATATAAVAKFAQGPQTAFARSAAHLLAPLAGWLSLATFANIEVTQGYTQSQSRRLVKPRTLLSMASAASAAGVTATRGDPYYMGAVAWGLGGIALKNAKGDPRLAVACVAAIMELAVAALAAGKAR